MVPVEAVQVTPALAVSLETVSVKVWEAPPMRVAVVGLTATLMAGAAGVLLPQPMREERRREAQNRRGRRELLDMMCLVSVSVQNVARIHGSYTAEKVGKSLRARIVDLRKSIGKGWRERFRAEFLGRRGDPPPGTLGAKV
jgi:spore maturation protein SpmB